MLDSPVGSSNGFVFAVAWEITEVLERDIRQESLLESRSKSTIVDVQGSLLDNSGGAILSRRIVDFCGGDSR